MLVASTGCDLGRQGVGGLRAGRATLELDFDLARNLIAQVLHGGGQRRTLLESERGGDVGCSLASGLLRLGDQLVELFERLEHLVERLHTCGSTWVTLFFFDFLASAVLGVRSRTGLPHRQRVPWCAGPGFANGTVHVVVHLGWGRTIIGWAPVYIPW